MWEIILWRSLDRPNLVAVTSVIREFKLPNTQKDKHMRRHEANEPLKVSSTVIEITKQFLKQDSIYNLLQNTLSHS